MAASEQIALSVDTRAAHSAASSRYWMNLEFELELKSGNGQMWFVPIQGTGNGWVLVCSNEEPGVLVVSYLGPAF